MDAGTRELLAGRNFAHIATVLPDGGPHSVAIWVDVDDQDRVVWFTEPGSRKARNVARDPRVSISVVGHDEPYRTAHVRGRVVETIEGDEATRVVDAISRKYTGVDFPYPGNRVLYVEVERDAYIDLPFEH